MDNFNFDFNNNNNNFTWSDGTPVQPWTDDELWDNYVRANSQPDLAPAYSQPTNENPAGQYPVAQPQMQEIAPIWQQQQQQQQQMATPPATPPQMGLPPSAMFVQPQQQLVYLPAAPQMAHQPSATPAAPGPQQQQMLAWSARFQSARRLRWTGPQQPTPEAILAASEAVPAKDRMSSGLGSRSGRTRENQIIERRKQKAMSQINRRAAKKAARSAQN
ncbi:hypothetical protein LTS10_011309 [Elasticomyces elasticus]|nr:hypothetical protein LTS10_011309 [Elasticomyces elasticus]